MGFTVVFGTSAIRNEAVCLHFRRLLVDVLFNDGFGTSARELERIIVGTCSLVLCCVMELGFAIKYVRIIKCDFHSVQSPRLVGS